MKPRLPTQSVIPGIMGDRTLCIHGTRIPTYMIWWQYRMGGWSKEEICQDLYPQLKMDQVENAIDVIDRLLELLKEDKVAKVYAKFKNKY